MVLPVSLNPFLHLYVASEPVVVPLSVTVPYSGSGKLPQLIATKMIQLIQLLSDKIPYIDRLEPFLTIRL